MRALLVVCGALLLSLSAGSNPTANENSGNAGAPRHEWDTNAAADSGVAGFTSKVSYAPGETVELKLVTDAPSVFITVYRLGYYGGQGARKVASVDASVSLPVRQSFTEGLPCSECTTTATWPVPKDAVSGAYLMHVARGDDIRETDPPRIPPSPSAVVEHAQAHARRHRELHQRASHFGNQNATSIVFVVRPAVPPDSAAVAFRVADMAWAATAVGSDRLAFDYPQGSRGDELRSFFSNDYPALRFLEEKGYSVAYYATSDLAEFAGTPRGVLGQANVLVLPGTEIAWPSSLREFLKASEAHGIARIFLGAGDPVFDAVPETGCREYRLARPASEGDIDVSGVTAQDFTWAAKSAAVSPSQGRLAVWADTRFAKLQSASKTLREAVGRAVGVLPHAKRPLSLLHLSNTSFEWTFHRSGSELHHSNEPVAHAMLLWRHPISDALTFHAASSGFSAALDGLVEVTAEPIVTPFGSTPRRTHLEKHSLAGDAALRGMLQSILKMAKVTPEGEAPYHRASEVQCEINSVTALAHDRVAVVARASDRHGTLAAMRVSTRLHEHLWTDLQPDPTTAPNDRQVIFQGELAAEGDAHVTAADVLCTAVDRSAFMQSAPSMVDTSDPHVPLSGTESQRYPEGEL